MQVCGGFERDIDVVNDAAAALFSGIDDARCSAIDVYLNGATLWASRFCAQTNACDIPPAAGTAVEYWKSKATRTKMKGCGGLPLVRIQRRVAGVIVSLESS